jgi:DNA-binding PadR family transcriptional regulator
LSTPELTSTSYAILGLLAIRPWTTYELARQMERTLNRIWPRARSKLYEEPKKLVARGLATARPDAVGRRARTVYAITAAGRRALGEWLAAPSSAPELESEPHLKLFFADHGSTSDALATLDAAQAWADDQLAEFAAVIREYLDGGGPFPERMATNAIGARFMVDFYRAVHDWAQWARGVVERWPDNPAEVPSDPRILEDILRRATTSAASGSRRPPESSRR